MSLWRSTQTSAKRNVSKPLPLLFLGTALLLASFANAQGPNTGISHTSVGPASEEEAIVLWQDARADYEAGRFDKAVPKLERYLARYPGRPGYLEARLLLARAFIRLDQPHKAKPLLKQYILSRGQSASAIAARIDLTRVQLAMGDDAEALLGSEEILKLAPRKDRALQSEALVIKAQALMGLNKDSRAVSAFESARKVLPDSAAPALKAEVADTELTLKLRDCTKFPSPGRLDEGAIRDQLQRRGTCLLESLLIYRKALAAGHLQWAQVASRRVAHHFSIYRQACTQPPQPPRIEGKERSEQELRTYFHEIGLVLKKECSQKTLQAIELLKSWKSSNPTTTADPLNQALIELEKLAPTR